MKNLLTVVPFLLIIIQAHSQDILTQKDGTVTSVKVIDTSGFYIKYLTATQQDREPFRIYKEAVHCIRYADGRIYGDTTQIIKTETARTIPSRQFDINSGTMYQLGIDHANIFYERTGGAATLTFTCSFLGGLVGGLIPAIACSNRIPPDKKLGFPEPALVNNIDYREGYITKAMEIKREAVWHSYWYGVIGTIVASSLIYGITTYGRGHN
ncbi:MAG: hypothetical protein JST82_03755 [Bacteroidetes bacterium]|nr:hypothetical protein [Bacteroidota bacterium]